MEKKELKGYLEFFSNLPHYQIHVEFEDLLTAADESQIHTFGWPIGVVLHTEEGRPKPYSQDAIQAVIDNPPNFDYWTLNKKGHYYILKTLFEDSRDQENNIFLDTRTIRTAELLITCFFRRLIVSDNCFLNSIRLSLSHQSKAKD